MIDPTIDTRLIGGYELERKQLIDLISIRMSPSGNKVCVNKGGDNN